MPSKPPSESLWNELKVWAAKNARRFLYVMIPAERTDTDEESARLKPGEHYFRVRLAHLSLEGSGSPQSNLYPALHSTLRLRYGDHGLVNLSRVAPAPEVVSAEEASSNLLLSDLMPYIGGKVELAAGVLALPRSARVSTETAVRLFSDIADVNAPPLNPSAEIFEVSGRVERGMKALMDSVGGRIHLGLHQPLGAAQTLNSGYVAAVVTDGSIDPERLFVKDERLHYGSPRAGSGLQPLKGTDYMLFRVEGHETRNEWRIKSIQEPVEKAVRALAGRRQDEASTFRLMAVYTAMRSPDLTTLDRFRVALAVNDHLLNIGAARRLPGEPPDLNRIMASHAMSLRLAKEMATPPLADMPPQAKLLEVHERDTLVWGGDPGERDAKKEGSTKKSSSKKAPAKGNSAHGLKSKKKKRLPGSPPPQPGPPPPPSPLPPPRGAHDESVPPAPDEKSKPAGGPATPAFRQFNAWIHERAGATGKAPLTVGDTYTLCFNVGFPVADSILDAHDAVVNESEIPDEGLNTTWFISSRNVELSAPHGEGDFVKVEKPPAPASWKAEFSLFIPKESESATRKLLVIPRAAEDAVISIAILARGTLYRQFDLKLKAVQPQPKDPDEDDDSPLSVTFSAVQMPGKYAGLAPPHEWQTPPGKLIIDVKGQGNASLLGTAVDPVSKLIGPVWMPTSWEASLTDEAGPIKALLAQADAFREAFSDELNDIDAADLEARLSELRTSQSRFWEDNLADEAHTRLWDEKIAKSEELRRLAIRGYTLYQTLFPDGSDLRLRLDSLHPGWRIDIGWQARNDQARPAHIPWGLLYTSPLKKGEPVDPMKFWGLRFRATAVTNVINNPKPPALGHISETAPAYGFYWGTEETDREIASEVKWQRAEWLKWGGRMFIPDEALAASPKEQLTAILTEPREEPTPVIYFFCQSSVQSGREPVLRFANSSYPEDNVEIIDLGQNDLENQPLVFVNACTSGSADPFFANELVSHFFRRKCRSYLGTEVKVPVRLASRFAKVFYTFFYRGVAPEPMAAGEAVFQARRLLWRDYRNIGGLLYNYINLYDLYMATAEELSRMPVRQ